MITALLIIITTLFIKAKRFINGEPKHRRVFKDIYNITEILNEIVKIKNVIDVKIYKIDKKTRKEKIIYAVKSDIKITKLTDITILTHNIHKNLTEEYQLSTKVMNSDIELVKIRKSLKCINRRLSYIFIKNEINI